MYRRVAKLTQTIITATNKVTFLVFLKFNHLVSMKGKEQNEINKQLKLINHCGSFVNNMEFLSVGG